MKRGTPPHTRYGTSELKDAWMEIRTLKRGGELNQIYELSSTELTAMSIIFKPILSSHSYEKILLDLYVSLWLSIVGVTLGWNSEDLDSHLDTIC